MKAWNSPLMNDNLELTIYIKLDATIKLGLWRNGWMTPIEKERRNVTLWDRKTFTKRLMLVQTVGLKAKKVMKKYLPEQGGKNLYKTWGGTCLDVYQLRKYTSDLT